jgi:hypothetical protein
MRRALIAHGRGFLLAHHVAVARAALGAYLAVHYALQAPYAAVLYGRGGMLPEARLNPSYPHAHSLLYALDAPWFVTALCAGLALVAAAYAAGLRTRTSAVVLFAGMYTLLHRNALTLNPSLPYLGLWLLAHAFFPADPAHSLDRLLARRRGVVFDPHPERVPRDVLRVLWIVTAVSYSYSGVTKLLSPSWRDGRAVALILGSVLGRDNLPARALLALPPLVTAGLTWATLLAELLYAPLALARRARPWLWAALLGLHAGLMLVVDIADISAAMVVFHLATFDPEWLGAGGTTGAHSTT